jgi:periplasmic mercuric ion binding protein
MKQSHLIIIFLFYTLFTIQPSYSRTIEVDVHGMTCAFCIDTVERKFNAMESIFKVEVSMKQKLIRLETDGNTPSIETINNTVLDAGFTPVNIRVLPN